MRRILDLSLALELGYRPFGPYAETVGPEIDRLIAEAQDRGTTDVQRTDFFDGLFDYAAEDRFLLTDR